MPVLARRVPALAFFLPLLLLVLAGPSTAAIKRTQEYDLKATFLFHFTRFVDWPSGTLAGKNTPFAIGILGEDPFGKSLDEIVANETVGGHKILVRRIRGIEQADSCQILFICASEAGRLERLLPHLRHRSILTVGDSKDFAQRAGMIGFVISQKRLRLAINLAAARDARLTISSKLLRQSQIVGPAQVLE
jgi:hypothetical protein